MRVTLVILSLLFSQFGYTQQTDSIRKVKLTNEFKFKDGLFFSFDQVKNNSPLAKSRIITLYDYSRKDFYDLILKNEALSFYDNNGVKQTFSTSNIWGYSKDGVLFVKVEEEYNRVTIVGAICHFVAIITSYEPSYYDPYRYNLYSNNSTTMTHTSKEMRQFVIDFKTGNILDYNVESVEALLMYDEKLYDEYISLKKKDKKNLKFLYIRKFNERNPIYLPIR